MDQRLIIAHLDKIKKAQNTAHASSYNAIIYGSPKIGKSMTIRTCVKPILVHSFDPGGTKVLQDLIDKGDVIADTRFEIETPTRPKSFEIWKKEMDDLEKSGFFNLIGTYVLDSFTTWAQCIMYEVVKRAADKSNGKRSPGSPPQQQDWLHQMNEIEIWMRRFTSLPCHCIAMGHDDIPTDEEGRQSDDRRPMLTGKLGKRVPALFDEIYYMFVKDQVKNVRMLQTGIANRIHAGTRLGVDGKLALYEPPDIKAIMKKVGLDTTDKPSLFAQVETAETAETEVPK